MEKFKKELGRTGEAKGNLQTAGRAR